MLLDDGAACNLCQGDSTADDQLAIFDADALHVLGGGHIHKGLRVELASLDIDHHVGTAGDQQRPPAAADQGFQGL